MNTMLISYILSLLTFLSALTFSSLTPEKGDLLWSLKLGGQQWAPITHSDGTLFFGSDDAHFYAVDVASRQVKWKIKTDGRIRSGSNVTDGIVTFASDDGILYALEAESGKEVWRHVIGSAGFERILPATGPPYEYDFLHSSPTYNDGTIYIGGSNGKLYAIDHQSGDEKWTFQSGQKIRSSPTVHDNAVYFGSWDGKVYAVNEADGEEIWQFDTGGIIQSSPAVGAEKVFVASRSARLFALDARSGDLAWQHIHTDGSWVESSPVYQAGVVYIGSSDALKLFAFDAETGGLNWEFRTGGWSWSTPVVSEGAVYIGGISAYPYYFEGVELAPGFFAVNQSDGEALWSMQPEAIDGYVTGGIISVGPAVDGIVFAAGIDGTLYAFSE